MQIQCTLTLFAFSCLISGCGDSVPSVSDPHNIVLDGTSITQQDFLSKYCTGKGTNETCNKVAQAMAADSSKSKAGPTRF